jgi:4-hydroxy-tetrahydrodipicolinate reductase
MTNIVVCGIAGRMGRRLAELTFESDDLQLSGATECPGHEAIGRDLGAFFGRAELGIRITDDVRSAVAADGVLINFTAPGPTVEAAEACAEAGMAMVVGTTGFDPEELARFKETAAKVPCVFAPNFSTAMNVLFKLVEDAARILGDEYDVEVIEAHHRHKVDAPSGSALGLAAKAAAGLDRNLEEVAVHGRQGQVGARTTKEIGMHAVRAGDLVGIHSVMYAAPGEFIELKHHATSRDAFALGALRAARFAAGAGPGLYDMQDVLGIG